MDARWWPIREERLLYCTHIIVSFLKAWKVTVVGIECVNAAFNVISRRSTPESFLSRKTLFSKFCKQGGKLDYSKYLY